MAEDVFTKWAVPVVRAGHREVAAFLEDQIFTRFEGRRLVKPSLPQGEEVRCGQPATRSPRTEAETNGVQRQALPGGPQAPACLQRGDQVMTKVMVQKRGDFLPLWSGPHLILEKLSDEVYVLNRGGLDLRVHVGQLRPAPERNPDVDDVASETSEAPDSTPSEGDSSTDTGSEDEERPDEGTPGTSQEPRITGPPSPGAPDQPGSSGGNHRNETSSVDPPETEASQPDTDGTPGPPRRQETRGPWMDRRGGRSRLIMREAPTSDSGQ